MQHQIVETGIIETYQSLVEAIPHILSSNNITHSIIFKGIGMSRSTWERRLKENSFSSKEMMEIANFINKKWANK